MESLQAAGPVVGVVGAALGFLGVVAVAVLWHRFQRFARPYEELARAAASQGSSAALGAALLGAERNAEGIRASQEYAQRIEQQLQFALQGVGFLKYDAFEDIRGTQSYSLCLLDAHQNGFIVTSIAGRNDYRGYAKPVKNGSCDLAMSEEEKQVLEMARKSLEHGSVANRAAKASKSAASAPSSEPANV
jgi:hypothetical protein